MAKLQIFVLVVALSQVYGNVVITTLPGTIEIAPEVELEAVPMPSVPEIITPPCVASVKAILQSIIDQLPIIQAPAPLPIDPVPEVEVPQVPEIPEIGLPEPQPEATLETPCTACFEHINTLLTSAEKVLAIRKMSQMLRI